MSEQINIIGGGVSGVTTALTLHLLGHETEILTDKTFTEISDKNAYPEFASLFPSASVIPHSVYSHQLRELFELSQAVFYELRKLMFDGLTLHRHFEVFEYDPVRPAYCDWMPNLQPLRQINAERIPQRSAHGPENLFGWVFDCIFADWSLYAPALVELYRQCGGTITHKKLGPDDIEDLPARLIINCSGTGSPRLFDDPADEHYLLSGHLLHKPGAPLITGPENEIISYNYTPRASVYADPDGSPCDVYCYPRKDGWILGGSRQSRRLDEEAPASHSGHTSTYTMNDITFPSQIIELNKDILETTFGQSLSHTEPLSPSLGYRYIRNRNNGLRLEKDSAGEKDIFHNYGHGGAGVTLSWGCALKIAEQISSVDISELKSKLLQQIDTNNR